MRPQVTCLVCQPTQHFTAPIDDLIEHRTEESADQVTCPCEPDVEWLDKEGEPLEEPIVIHNAIDGRE